MGKFFYSEMVVADFDDRLLAHLEIVITAKLRRGEGFNFSWRDDARVGDGRTTVWLHPNADLVYKYYGSRPPHINRGWIDVLTQAAHSAGGLRILEEPHDPHEPDGSRPQ